MEYTSQFQTAYCQHALQELGATEIKQPQCTISTRGLRLGVATTLLQMQAGSNNQ